LLSTSSSVNNVAKAAPISAWTASVVKDKSSIRFLVPWKVAVAVAIELFTNLLSANWLSRDAAPGILSSIADISSVLACSAALALFCSSKTSTTILSQRTCSAFSARVFSTKTSWSILSVRVCSAPWARSFSSLLKKSKEFLKPLSTLLALFSSY